MRQVLSMRERSVTLLLNVLVALAVNYVVSGSVIPDSGLAALWFTCAVSFWFLTLVSAPWFVPPRDALISGMTALILLVAVDSELLKKSVEAVALGHSLAVAYSIIVIFFAVVAQFLYDADERSPPGSLAFRITETFGRGEILFSAPALLSIYLSNQNDIAVVGWLVLYWLMIVIVRPIERLLIAWKEFRASQTEKQNLPTVGKVMRVDHPNIVRVRLSTNSNWSTNRLYTASMPDGKEQFILSLFSQTQGTEVVGTGLCLATAQEKLGLPDGTVVASHDEERTTSFIEELSGSKQARIVGFVVENSKIADIAFEVASTSQLVEGGVVYARVRAQEVFYQIVGAETFEENFDQNPRGTHVVRASQLGVYTAENGFEKFPWLPDMNTPVFDASSRDFDAPILSDDEFLLGRLAPTNINAVAKVNELVEYHSAILGVTGTGKTELALDLIRNCLRAEIKVFCVDFTGEYRHRLSNLCPIFPSPTQEEGEDLEQKLFDVETGEYRAQAEKRILKEATDSLRASTEQKISEFLESEDSHLAIFELAEISNTKASLHLTELYLSSIMDWARRNFRQKRVLIVLEEAHTIVPEVIGSGLGFDTQFVVSRIGQIALQGRKYGVGLMVISQRTALVSKTILSQCNTFLTHSLIDQTSLNFLESVYSTQQTRLIPNLGRFAFLAFGKAIKAERPIVLQRKFDQAKLDASQAVRQNQSQADECDATDEISNPIEADTGPSVRSFED